MSEMDLIISNIAEEIENTPECVSDSCQKTLMNYQSLKNLEGLEQPLRMVAWDRD